MMPGLALKGLLVKGRGETPSRRMVAGGEAGCIGTRIPSACRRHRKRVRPLAFSKAPADLEPGTRAEKTN